MYARTPAMREVKTLMTGIHMGECARWHDGRLWFADWVGEKLYTLDAGGKSEVVAEIASLPFSIDWLPDGRLMVVNARENKLQRREPDGSFVTHAGLGILSPFGCNEIVVDGRGNVYVNNVNLSLGSGMMEAYQDFQQAGARPGFVALLTPDGALRRVAEGLAFPNGMAITPDGGTLIVAESFSADLTAFDIAADGSLSNRRLWAHIEGQGGDGICMDAEGAVWASSGPRCVRLREGGEVLDEVRVDRMCFSCMLGGADGRTLFIVANDWTGEVAGPGGEPTGRIYAAEVEVPHAGYP
ncbi:MAG TPA: SMP-30/gluconolactonase/LRE family protein [Devosiaceae bacterium]|nr:SMP-30/gluconolactonase/LRE family protein [Devosiaceae bacterium]